jgi:hypothetical protein
MRYLNILGYKSKTLLIVIFLSNFLVVLFNEMELEHIKREFTYNDTRRLNRNEGGVVAGFSNGNKEEVNETDNFTEYGLETTQNSLLKNATTKSVILAPFNSTLTHISDKIYQEEIEPNI